MSMPETPRAQFLRQLPNPGAQHLSPGHALDFCEKIAREWFGHTRLGLNVTITRDGDGLTIHAEPRHAR